MPYTVTVITTYPSVDTPKFRQWLKTVDSEVLLPFPETNGMTPVEVDESQFEDVPHHEGFLGREVILDYTPTSSMYTSFWSNSSAYRSTVQAPTSGNVPVLDSNNQPVLNSLGQPTFYTPIRYLFKMYCDQYGVTQTSTKIES